MKALVTGASGLIGSNIVRALLARGHAVRALVRPTSSLSGLEGLPVELARGDVLRPDDLNAAVQACDSVFHAAANYSYWGKTAEELELVATEGTANILKAARGGGVSRVVVTSSSVVFGYELDQGERDESDRPCSGRGGGPLCARETAAGPAGDGARVGSGHTPDHGVPDRLRRPPQPDPGPSNAIVVAYLRDPWRTTYPGGCNIVSARDVGLGHVLSRRRVSRVSDTSWAAKTSSGPQFMA